LSLSKKTSVKSELSGPWDELIAEVNSTEASSEVSDLILKDSEVAVDVDPVTQLPVVLGQGRFGKVLRGTMLGVQPVAIKCITCVMDDVGDQEGKETQNTSQSQLSLKVTPSDQILNEIALLKSCRSQYVVSLLGAMMYPGEMRLVTELMSGGDLWKALGRGSQRTVSWYTGGIFIAIDVAAGLKYLHEKRRVIHLDLKSSNILLSNRATVEFPEQLPDGYSVTHRAKISDVGLSKMLPFSREYIADLDVGGTWNWCAPEVILNSKCTSSADMYSYGVVLWEICTGEIPVRGRMRDVQVPDECPQEVADLISACIDAQTPASRPTASEAYASLQRLLPMYELL
jgi:serine/threonine protein kinase